MRLERTDCVGMVIAPLKFFVRILTLPVRPV